MHSDRNYQETRLTLIYAVLLGAVAVGYRLVPPYLLGPGSHFAWNLMPVGALALFVGARLPSLWAWLVPLGAMVASDLLLIPAYAAQGIDSISWTTTPFIYASFALYALLGRLVTPRTDSPSVLLAAFAGSVQFFLVTNFAVWAFGVLSTGEAMYAKTLPALAECFALAIPFSKGTFIGDLLFTSLFFAGHAVLISARASSPQEAV
jgi:hypothetical protein